jgi:signal transduction histidine kinase
VPQFVAGFVVALLVLLPAAAFFLYKRVSKFRKAQESYLKRLEELSRLTGALAHEIKNPLSTIKVNLQLISEELQTAGLGGGEKGVQNTREPRLPRALRKIGVLQKETERLEQILEGFLRYLDRTELQRANVDINELMSDMLDFYRPQAVSHSITLRQGLYGEPLVCRIDPDMIKQAVLNLFINAQQAMSDGGELMVRTSRRKKEAIIEISDTGSGIAPERLGTIFDGYHSARPLGSGLGLPVVRKVIEAHNGTISVSSEVGKGTSFTISLPMHLQ